MKINTAKQKMLSGKPALGFAAKLGSPVAAEFLSHCGAEFVMLDTQHGSWGDDSMIAGVTSVCTGAATPRSVIRDRSLAVTRSIRSSLRLQAIARRSSSASAPLKPAMTIAIRSTCSWKIGTPSVRWRIFKILLNALRY